MSFDSNNASAAKPTRAADPMNDLRLATARKRLAESSSQEDALEGLREIVANLLGCEEIGLFQSDGSGRRFSLRWSFGADLKNYDLVKALGEAGWKKVMQGEWQVQAGDGERSGGAKAQAYIPIRAAGRTVGILGILRLLPQKTAFDAHDLDLFKLLSEEAAKPLFGASDRSAGQANKTERRS
jgi:hypothetical protein